MSEQFKEMTYQQALKRLNELVAEIEDPGIPVEKIMDKVKESVVLIQFCRSSLRDTKEEIDNILNEKS
ncbi:MAG: exodeoxyribonuclease VII small subunit [Bacteroidales bacterium]|nr:exodeoxyribonuclease VII small subunit [Bacteroidales bacterium]